LQPVWEEPQYPGRKHATAHPCAVGEKVDFVYLVVLAGQVGCLDVNSQLAWARWAAHTSRRSGAMRAFMVAVAARCGRWGWAG